MIYNCLFIIDKITNVDNDRWKKMKATIARAFMLQSKENIDGICFLLASISR